MRRLFIADGATCMCKFGSAPGRLKVISHDLLYINAFHKMGTSGELQNAFYPPAFGTCTYSSPYTRPCSPAVINWTELYKDMRVMGLYYPLMPESKATCALAGTPCIDIIDHGQIEILGPSQIKNRTSEFQSDLDPLGNLRELDEEEFSITAQLIKK